VYFSETGKTKRYSELSESLQWNCMSPTPVPGSKGFGSFCPTQQEQDEKKPVWQTQSGEDGPRQREDGGVGGAPRRMKGARRMKMLVRTR
jgi:hypothetical protein